jgi:hypothetical protein
MKIKKMLSYLLAGVLAGCVPVMSLHPLYDDQHLVFEEKLLGTYTDADGNNATWEFTRSNEPNVYQLAITSVEDQKVAKGLFAAHLIKLDEHFFLDVFPKEAPWGDEKELGQAKWPYNSFFYIPVHTFIKIETIEPQLKLWLTDDDGLKKLLKENPGAIGYESIDDTPVLTAPTPQLQAFILKYADEKRLFSNEHVLSRKFAEPNVPCTNDISKDSNQTRK